MVVVWAGWLNRLEDGRVSLSVGGSQSRLMGVAAGVDGKEGVGAGVHGGAAGVLDSGAWEGGLFAGEESETGVGGGALTKGLAEDGGAGVCVVAEVGLGFKKGTGVATGVFLGLALSF